MAPVELRETLVLQDPVELVIVIGPPPAPTEDAITVCVIDPTSPNGIRMQTAIFVHATGDTVVDVNGRRTPLAQAVACWKI